MHSRNGSQHQTWVLVTGTGGFTGHHLTRYLVERGYWVRGVDLKHPEYEPTAAHEFQELDLRRWESALQATRDVDEVYNLAANMGGIGFIESHKAEIMRDSSLIDLHVLEAARINRVQRLLYSSSACVYPGYLQQSADVTPLREEDAYPAHPEDSYGWQKLFTERQCRHYFEDFGLETRVVRFHNIYGPLGTYDGGREKSPAAICRKVALAKDGDAIEVWGDGQQTRSYCTSAIASKASIG
jgi:nucleoside-diphosphate-sugar epimerase